MPVSARLNLLQTTHRIVVGLTGVDLRRTLRSARNLPHFLRTVRAYHAGKRGPAFPLSLQQAVPDTG